MIDFGFYNMDTYKMSYMNHENIREHRKVISIVLGRELSPCEIVHHIDGNKRNNDISNLKILSRSEHAKLHSETLRHRARPVIQISEDTIIKTWGSAQEVCRQLGFSKSNICNCCRGKIKTCYGYVWRYADVGDE